MDYVPLIALGVSVLALAISGLGFWLSWRSQYHNRIVSFEQLKQQIRQRLFEGLLLVGEANDELNRCTDTKTFMEAITAVAGIRRKYEDLLKRFDRLPATPSTEARLELEQIGGMAIELNNDGQTILKHSHLMADFDSQKTLLE